MMDQHKSFAAAKLIGGFCALMIIAVPAQAGWLPNWLSGDTAPSSAASVPSAIPSPIVTERPSTTPLYGGPESVVVSAPGVWDKTKTAADIESQKRYIHSRAVSQGMMTEAILDNYKMAKRAAEQAERMAARNAAGVPSSLQSPRVLINPVSPKGETTPFGSPLLGQSSTVPVQPILPKGVAAGVPPVSTMPERGIQPILPVLRPPAPVAPLSVNPKTAP